MPYFKWVGIDISGTIKKGKQPALSSQDLSIKLFRQGIALLQSKLIRIPKFLWSVDDKAKGELFAQKARLLKAGVLLPNVLEVISQQSHNPIIHDVFADIVEDIQRGILFAKALEKHQNILDPIVVIMLTAGSESGNIIRAMENVALYFHKQYTFKKNLRSVLAMPILTLLFFLGVSFFIFVFIIPRFAEMFSSLQQQLPPLPQVMISIGDFVSSMEMACMIVFIGIAIVCLHCYFDTKLGRKKWNSIISHIPFLNTIIWQHYISQALQAIALLINSGVPLIDSLKIMSDSIDYEEVKLELYFLHDDIAGGKLLSNGMIIRSVFYPEDITLIRIGEESGTLANSLEAVALIYSDKLDETLRRFIFFLQPVVIILLGLLVALLIFAIYSPIMQLSYVL